MSQTCRRGSQCCMSQVMMGGAWFEQHFGPPEKADHEEIGIVAAEEMQAQLNFPLDPCTTLVHVHKVKHACAHTLTYTRARGLARAALSVV